MLFVPFSPLVLLRHLFLCDYFMIPHERLYPLSDECFAMILYKGFLSRQRQCFYAIAGTACLDRSSRPTKMPVRYRLGGLRGCFLFCISMMACSRWRCLCCGFVRRIYFLRKQLV